MRSIRYGGKTVSFREYSDDQAKKFVEARLRYGNMDVCPLCKRRFVVKNTTGVVLIVSNQVGIPNRFVHSECMADKTDEYAFRLIAEDYKEAQKYADWFPAV